MAAAAVTEAPLAGAATAANRTYVQALYGDLLDRTNTSANAAGEEFWANRLATHPRADVVRSIQLSSREYYGQILDIAYAIYLNRAPNGGGRAFLVNQWRSGRFTFERAVAALVGSREYFTKSGGTNAGFVDKAYADILGGEPPASARSYFVRVAQSRGRDAVAVLLATSHQARVALVRDRYDTFLGRAVDTASLRFWVSRLSDGLRRELFDVALLSSSEYYAKNS